MRFHQKKGLGFRDGTWHEADKQTKKIKAFENGPGGISRPIGANGISLPPPGLLPLARARSRERTKNEARRENPEVKNRASSCLCLFQQKGPRRGIT